jgi:hypothetical protein
LDGPVQSQNLRRLAATGDYFVTSFVDSQFDVESAEYQLRQGLSDKFLPLKYFDENLALEMGKVEQKNGYLVVSSMLLVPLSDRYSNLLNFQSSLVKRLH